MCPKIMYYRYRIEQSLYRYGHVVIKSMHRVRTGEKHVCQQTMLHSDIKLRWLRPPWRPKVK